VLTRPTVGAGTGPPTGTCCLSSRVGMTNISRGFLLFSLLYYVHIVVIPTICPGVRDMATLQAHGYCSC
jgi:hypothetical protein